MGCWVGGERGRRPDFFSIFTLSVSMNNNNNNNKPSQFRLGQVRGDGFVTTSGIQLMLDGKTFYKHGFNAYWLMLVAYDPSTKAQVTTSYQQASSQGLTVMWARDQGQQISSDDGFFTNLLVKQFYKNNIQTVLTRQNTITGVAYKDDPTIMAWELMNAPEWINEMASFVKSIDSNHLLAIGSEGYYGSNELYYNPNNYQSGTDFITHNQISGIDFATVHTYPDHWLSNLSNDTQLTLLQNWVQQHIKDAHLTLGKPVLFEEFGRSFNEPGYSNNARLVVYKTLLYAVYYSANISGAALYWQLLMEGTVSSYQDGYGIEFSQSPDIAAVISDQSRKLASINQTT
ncbi:Mannan endo-1,4-beta-mannosidase 1-like protein [Drosera capensis]